VPAAGSTFSAVRSSSVCCRWPDCCRRCCSATPAACFRGSRLVVRLRSAHGSCFAREDQPTVKRRHRHSERPGWRPQSAPSIARDNVGTKSARRSVFGMPKQRLRKSDTIAREQLVTKRNERDQINHNIAISVHEYPRKPRNAEIATPMPSAQCSAPENSGIRRFRTEPALRVTSSRILHVLDPSWKWFTPTGSRVCGGRAGGLGEYSHRAEGRLGEWC